MEFGSAVSTDVERVPGGHWRRVTDAAGRRLAQVTTNTNWAMHATPSRGQVWREAKKRIVHGLRITTYPKAPEGSWPEASLDTGHPPVSPRGDMLCGPTTNRRPCTRCPVRAFEGATR